MLKLTAAGSGYYRVFVNGVQVSQHVAEREAIESAADHALTGAAVYYDHDYHVDVESAVAPPAEPEPPVEPEPAPEPPHVAPPPSDAIVIDVSQADVSTDGQFDIPALPGYYVKSYGRDRDGVKSIALRNGRIEDGGLFVDQIIDDPSNRIAAGFYLASADRTRNLADAVPGIAHQNRMAIDIWLPGIIYDEDGAVLGDRALDPAGYVEALYKSNVSLGDYHNRQGRTTGEDNSPEENNQHFYWQTNPRYFSNEVATGRWEVLPDGWMRYTVSLTTPTRQRGGSDNHNFMHEPTLPVSGYGMAESLTRFYLSIKGFNAQYFIEGRWGIRTIRFFHEPEGVSIERSGAGFDVRAAPGTRCQLVTIEYASNLADFEETFTIPDSGVVWVAERGGVDAYTVRDLDGLGAATVEA